MNKIYRIYRNEIHITLNNDISRSNDDISIAIEEFNKIYGNSLSIEVCTPIFYSILESMKDEEFNDKSYIYKISVQVEKSNNLRRVIREGYE